MTIDSAAVAGTSLTGSIRIPEARPVHELLRRVRLQTLFRIAAGLVLLAVTAVLQRNGGAAFSEFEFGPLYALIAFIFATSIPAALSLRRLAEIGLYRLATAQFVIDVGVTTALVYLTGGAESPVAVLYVLPIMNASAVLYRRGALLTGAGSAIAYGLLVDLSYYRIVPPFAPEMFGGEVGSREALYRVTVSSVGFLLTAALGSYLAEVARRAGRELAETSVDLRALQALTKNIVENISSGLLTVGRDGRITSFNRSAEEISGWRLAEVLGRPVRGLFPGVSERLSGSATSEPRRYEERFVHRDGRERVLGFSYSPLRNDADEEIGTIVIFQDLTELREMESRLKREERLAAVGRLAAGIAHEIRNPLGAISGSIQMLRSDRGLSQEERRLMEIILRETDRLNGLISEFLDYVKPVRQIRARVDVIEVARETADGLRATEVGREVEVRLPEARDVPSVKGDRDRLKQVLWNLFLNSAQAMAGKGRIELSLATTRLGVSGEMVLLEVADSGPGIRPEEMPRIFEPFYTTKERGTGLGLAMVHKIVEAHEGHIEVDSEPGRGARFRLLLPCYRAD